MLYVKKLGMCEFFTNTKKNQDVNLETISSLVTGFILSMTYLSKTGENLHSLLVLCPMLWGHAFK